MRYIPMDGLIIEGRRQFAFFDTIVDRFVVVDGDQTWESVADLVSSFNWAIFYDEQNPTSRLAELRERLVGLARGNGALEESQKNEDYGARSWK